MNKKMSKRQRDLKSKLMAAICMLLVSSIMMVSTTYAWFTLSTAPEVTGITTAVGANGNLEMALLPVDGGVKGADETYGITSTTSDSMATQDATDANVTWGNLVDLGAKTGNENAYGLDKITLYPAAMNVTDGKLDTSIFLKVPVYGADGRVASLTPNTFAGIYTGSKFSLTGIDAENNPVSAPTGVRAIGTVSSMSDQEIAFRAAQSAASGLAVRAQTAAAKALEDRGNALAAIAIHHYLGKGNEMYSETTHVAPLKDMTEALLAKGDDKGNGRGAIPLIEDAIKQYVWAYYIANNADYEANRTNILDAADIKSLLSYVPSDSVYATMINKLVVDRDAEPGEDGGTKGITEDALTALDSLAGTEIAWTDISSCLSMLASTDLMTIGGVKVDDLTLGILFSAMTNGGLSLSLPSGSGVFADVADHVGNYGASIMVDATAVDSTLTQLIPATMTTATTVANGGYQAQAKAHLAGLTLQGSGAAADSVTDIYGYVIDLAFRTNAAGSKLRLQSEAADRLYTDDANRGKHEETMGHGSSMSFEGLGSFENNSVKNLMKSIRIVFFKPEDGTILCYGYLDDSKPDYTNGVKMNMHLSSTNPKDQITAITNDDIMQLNQNQAHRLSVLVYLDGETVENKDVAYNTAMSMSGSINLQFSSSANLVPMNYTNLAALDGSGTGNGGNSTPTLPDNIKVIDNASAGNDYDVIAYYDTNAKTVGAVISQKTTGKQVITGSTVQIGDKAASYQEIITGVSGWVVGNVETQPESVTITVANAVLAPSTFDVTAPVAIDGVTFTGNGKATENADYSFTLVNTTAKEYTVSYKIGESTVDLDNLAAKGAEATEDVTGNYTIEGTAVTGNIEIIVAEVSNAG